MRRKQFQRGSVRARQHRRRKVWVAQWLENGGKRSKVLGQIPEVSKGQAEAMLSKILAPINDCGVRDQRSRSEDRGCNEARIRGDEGFTNA